jgi:hypothetical protein
VAAQLDQEADGHAGDLTKVAVVFELYRSDNATLTTPDVVVGPVFADASGFAEATTTLGTDAWLVVVRFNAGNRYFTGPPTQSVVTVYTPAPGKVTGGGWVPTEDGARVSGFVVQNKSGRTGVSGNVTYLFEEGGQRYLLRVTSWANGSLNVTPDGRRATISGKASLTVLQRKGSARTLTGVTFQIDLADSRTTSPDAFAVTVWRNGSVFHQTGSPTALVSLSGGQVVIHLK